MVAKMPLGRVYQLYLAKIQKKGRTKEELNSVIEWLTGYDETSLINLVEQNVSLQEFFNNANLNPKAHLITGTICGYRIEEIQNPLLRKVRYLDKLVDELAKGRKMDKIFRK